MEENEEVQSEEIQPEEIAKELEEKIQTEEIVETQSETVEMQENEEVQSEEMQTEEIVKEPEEKIQTEEIAEIQSETVEMQENEDAQSKEIQKKESAINELKEKIEQLENNRNVITEDFDEMYTKLFGTKPIEEKEEEPEELEDFSTKAIDIIKDNVNVFDDIEEYKKPVYKFIGIAFNTYIILEMEKELYILDQHAAHERIMYEKVKENYYSDETKNSQMLLLPDIITLTHKEMDIARDNMEMFAKAGFELEEFGENTIKLSGVPDICIDLDTKELFLETLDEINSVARTAKQEIEEKFLATVACKAAVKAHMVLTKEEVESLLDNLLELPNPFTCPHGRPTAIKMTQYDIERKFARK